LKRTPVIFLQRSYKDLQDNTKKTKLQGGMKGIKRSNDFALPPSFFFTEEFVVQQLRINLLKIL
jgi:hypothetical protein